MKTITITRAVTTLALAATLAACSTPDEAVVPTPTETTTQEPTSEPTTPSPTDPATPDVVIPTEVGSVVTADQIEAAREAGVAVYVSPNGDGNGIVIDPTAPLPEAVVSDAEAIDGVVADSAGMFEQGEHLYAMRLSLDEAGVPAIFIIAVGEVSGTSFTITGYTTMANRLVSGFAKVTNGSKGDAVSAAQAYASANPGTTVFDLTD